MKNIKESALSNHLDEIINKLSTLSWQAHYSGLFQTLYDEISEPLVLAVTGRVNSGKSYLINTILGKDLAPTKPTPATSTVNVYKKGKAPYPSTPILCHWKDGKKEWVSLQFVRNLQKLTKAAIKRSSQISELIFYVDDCSILDCITIIDLPGTEANTEHDGQVSEYFNIITKQNNSDAIIFMYEDELGEADIDFLLTLRDDAAGMSSYNILAVTSKIDLLYPHLLPSEATVSIPCELKQLVNSIIPISSAVYRYIPSLEDSEKIKKILHSGVPSREVLERLFRMNDVDFASGHSVEGCSLSIKERKRLLGLVKVGGKDGCPWSAFKAIITVLYENSASKACKLLKARSGIGDLKLRINRLLERKSILKKDRLLKNVGESLKSIEYDREINQLRRSKSSQQLDECVSACSVLQPGIRRTVVRILNEHMKQCEAHSQLFDLIAAASAIVESEKAILEVDIRAEEGIELLSQHEGLMSDAERRELKQIFIEKKGSPERLDHWRVCANFAMVDSVLYRLADSARFIIQSSTD